MWLILTLTPCSLLLIIIAWVGGVDSKCIWQKSWVVSIIKYWCLIWGGDFPLTYSFVISRPKLLQSCEFPFLVTGPITNTVLPWHFTDFSYSLLSRWCDSVTSCTIRITQEFWLASWEHSSQYHTQPIANLMNVQTFTFIKNHRVLTAEWW